MPPNPQLVRSMYSRMASTDTSRTAVFLTTSMTAGSSKRSAGAAGMDSSAGTSGRKRQRTQKNSGKTTQTLSEQAGRYAGEKFSDSFSISHVLNLLVEGENRHVHKWLHRLT